MNSKTFVSPDRRFSLRLPPGWEEYDDGEENTFAFYNTKSWTGNFRITPFYWTKPNIEGENKAAEFIQDELVENEGAIKFKLGKFDCTHYKRDAEEDNKMFVMYYWAVGKNENLFMCSLTIDKDQENKQGNKDVLILVEDMIKSIKIY